MLASILKPFTEPVTNLVSFEITQLQFSEIPLAFVTTYCFEHPNFLPSCKLALFTSYR